MEYEKILLQKLEKLFPDNDIRSKAVTILGEYGIERYEQEPVRLRLAALKLFDGSLDELKKYISYAKQDFRDVLSWAEYPRQSKKWSMPDGPKKEALVKADRAEYEKWLNT